MKITVDERYTTLRVRLEDRLQKAAALRCADHDSSVVAVTILARENGWFESLWTTCCERLTRSATTIVGNRC